MDGWHRIQNLHTIQLLSEEEQDHHSNFHFPEKKTEKEMYRQPPFPVVLTGTKLLGISVSKIHVDKESQFRLPVVPNLNTCDAD